MFRGHSETVLLHQTVIEFCEAIQTEIENTLAVIGKERWPFILRDRVVADIHSIGYRYLPLRFTLDQEQIHRLLMGTSL